MNQKSQSISTVSVHQAVNSSIELKETLLSPDKITFDSTSVLALDEDVSSVIENERGFTPYYSIGQVRSVFDGSADKSSYPRSDLSRFGDAVAEGLFIEDLLDVSQSKPLIKEFDENGVLLGFILALNRDIDSKLQSVFDSVGINYPNLFIAGVRPSLHEQRALALMKGLDPENSALRTPWFLRVAMADQQVTCSIRSTLQNLTPAVNSDSPQNEDALVEILPEDTVFSEVEKFKKFLGFVMEVVANQSQGETLMNFVETTGQIDSQTRYIEPIDSKHKFDKSVLLTPTSTLHIVGDKLFKDEPTGYECSLVGGRFLVQTTPSFMPYTSWLRVKEVSDEYAESVDGIVQDEKREKLASLRKSSIFQ